jgi:Protein of unknown function (DUF2795)
MERETAKHGPRVDDELQHEVESLTRGNAAEESHSREDRVQEGPAEGEMRFEPADRTLTDTSGLGVDPQTADERSELARHVVSAPWPARRDDLVAAAQSERAPQPVLDRLRTLPAQARFENVQEVWSALGGSTEEAHTQAKG